MSVVGVRRGVGGGIEQSGPLGSGATAPAAADDPGFEALGTLEAIDVLDALDALDGADSIAEAEAVARLAGHVRTVDDALAAPSPEHLQRALDGARSGEALARVVARGARPGESPQEARMRALVARLLELRHETSAGMGKVSIG